MVIEDSRKPLDKRELMFDLAASIDVLLFRFCEFGGVGVFFEGYLSVE